MNRDEHNRIANKTYLEAEGEKQDKLMYKWLWIIALVPLLVGQVGPLLAVGAYVFYVKTFEFFHERGRIKELKRKEVAEKLFDAKFLNDEITRKAKILDARTTQELKNRVKILSTEDKSQLDSKPTLNKLSDEQKEMYQSLQDYKDGKL